MWGELAAPPSVALHFGFGLGAFIAPMVAAPFLGEKRNATSPAENGTIMHSENGTTIGNESYQEDGGNIVIPWAIIGSMCLLWLILNTIFYIHTRLTKAVSKYTKETPKVSLRKMLSLHACVPGDKLFGVVMLCLLCYNYVHFVGSERAYSSFLFTFATENNIIRLSKDSAATLNSVFWISFTSGRFCAILASKFVPIIILMAILISGNLVNGIVMGAAAWRVDIILWIFTGKFLHAFIYLYIHIFLYFYNIYFPQMTYTYRDTCINFLKS